ncbi:glycosyltransferase family 4 protein [Candidatus Uhrbacteria bacterium]|nr:glycosyltransferase family 4 protein [Candidatus Uhrbacteria bacterium]
MKILHINKFFDLHGGTEVYLQALMDKQKAAGYEVHALSTISANNNSSVDAARFVERFNMDRREGLVKDAKKAVAFLWNVEAKKATEKAIKELKPDVIHLHNIYHHLSSSVLRPIRASKIPCVQTLHDLKLACPNYRMYTENALCNRCLGGKYWNAITHHCLAPTMAPNMLAALEMGMTKFFQSYEKTVGMFICPSQFMLDKMVEWGEPAPKMTVVPNPVEIPQELTIKEKNGYLLSAGRLSTEKGINILIEAAAKVPHILIRIAGTGPLEASLKATVVRLKLKNVEFLGYVRKADMIPLRAGAVAMVMPNIGYENASLTALEALADGVPLIASRIGGLPEQAIPGQTGMLVEPGDSDGLAAAMQQLWQLPQAERDRLGQNGRKLVEQKHSWSKHLSALEQVYRGVIRNA